MSDNNQNTTDKGMKTPLIISGAIHVIIFLLVIFGLPHFSKPPEIVDSIPIDMVADISEMTTAVKPPVKAPEPKEKKDDKPVKVEKPAPPKQVTPPPSEELKEPPKEDKKAVVKDDLAPPKPKEEKKPEKKQPPKKPTPPKPDKKEDDSQDLDKLLQDLSPDKPAPKQPDAPESKLMTEPTPSPNVSKFSDVLSMSEQDALRQQLAGCWNINAGMMNAQDLAVEIKVIVNPDRTVSSVKVVDQGRYNSDSLFRIMADSAIRAVQNPRCSPLKLPEDKYNLWHDMTVVFDPKEMF